MSNAGILKEKKTRICKAITLEKPDRVPVVLLGDSFCANTMGVKLSEFITDVKLSHEVMLNCAKSLGDVDSWILPQQSYAVFQLAWLSNMKLPGRELPEGTLWQLDEAELMTQDDYDTILEKGWNNFLGYFLSTKLSSKSNLLGDLQVYMEHFPQAIKNFEEAGIVIFSPVLVSIPFDVLTGPRSMSAFIKDLYRMPDKIVAVMDMILAENIETLKQQIRATKPLAVWINGMRSASEFLSPKLWQRMVWPYIKKIVETIVDEGAFAYLHFDASWDRDLEFFRELPKGKCIFGTDHFTDIYKLKEVLGDHMCILGDVPPALLTLGTPDEVYNYSLKLINEIGPSGFILSQGCCIPPNAKVENVKAMISAATGK